jgi:hypothetical protein
MNATSSKIMITCNGRNMGNLFARSPLVEPATKGQGIIAAQA